MLPALIGHQRAAELLMLGAPLTAQRAYELGLVNAVVAPDALFAATSQAAHRAGGETHGRVTGLQAADEAGATIGSRARACGRKWQIRVRLDSPRRRKRSPRLSKNASQTSPSFGNMREPIYLKVD